jgi:hypothetical protein
VPGLTIGWPVMRRAVLRIGEALVERGVIADPDEVFFLTRDEALSALDGSGLPATVNVAERRAVRDEQGELVAPLIVGRMTRMMTWLWEKMPRLVGAVP